MAEQDTSWDAAKWEGIKAAFEKMQQSEPKQPNVCPRCGYCPHCGRGGQYAHPRPQFIPYYWLNNG